MISGHPPYVHLSSRITELLMNELLDGGFGTALFSLGGVAFLS
jgi:hypothetical protein